MEINPNVFFAPKNNVRPTLILEETQYLFKKNKVKET